MFKLKIKDHRKRETRVGRELQYELVIDCELEPNGRVVQISAVIRSDEEMNDLYTDISYVINAGNNAIENGY